MVFIYSILLQHRRMQSEIKQQMTVHHKMSNHLCYKLK